MSSSNLLNVMQTMMKSEGPAKIQGRDDRTLSKFASCTDEGTCEVRYSPRHSQVLGSGSQSLKPAETGETHTKIRLTRRKRRSEIAREQR